MLRLKAGSLALTVLGFVAGCGAAEPPPAPVTPATAAAKPPQQARPTPASVTMANPGGDAADPELAALELLDHQGFSARRDREGTLSVQLAGAKYWRRVRLWGYPTRVAFRFGDEHYGVVAVWYEPAKGPDDPESCLKRFIAQGRPAAEMFGVRATEVRMVRTLQIGPTGSKPMVIDVIDAAVDGLTEPKEFAGALAAYESWPGTCLVQGFIVSAAKHHALAHRIRDRWVAEAAPKLGWTPRVTAAPAFDSR
ncbi:Hypothetical protein A7982_09041 [Minicystis rosea]|nr:Hypothetical protein A7982_09041 [Minicystis rosea]